MPTEHEQRRIHVRHAGQVAGVHCGVQRWHKLRRVQRDPVVPGMEKVVHFADVGCIRAGLKFCRVEVLFVVPVAHRERLQLVALRRKMRIGDGRNQAGIQPAGQKRCHGHVGHELPLDSIGDEVAHPAGRGGEVVGVVVVLEPPVGVQGQAGCLGLIDSVLAWQQLPHILKYTAARRAPWAKQQHLGQAVGIDAGRHSGVRQQGLQLTAKYQRVLRLRVEQRLDAAAVPRQKQRTCVLLPDSKRKNAVAPGHAVCAPLGKSVEQYLGVGVPVEAVPAGGQCGAQLGRVVELAVINQHVGFTLPVQLHGLQAVFEIHNRQPRVDERRRAADVHTALVRPAPRQRLLHGAVGRVPPLDGPGVAPDLPRNSAHKNAPFA